MSARTRRGARKGVTAPLGLIVTVIITIVVAVMVAIYVFQLWGSMSTGPAQVTLDKARSYIAADTQNNQLQINISLKNIGGQSAFIEKLEIVGFGEVTVTSPSLPYELKPGESVTVIGTVSVTDAQALIGNMVSLKIYFKDLPEMSVNFQVISS